MDINFVCSDEGKELGRPQLDVSRDEIKSLRALKFSWIKIARMLGISRQMLAAPDTLCRVFLYELMILVDSELTRMPCLTN